MKVVKLLDQASEDGPRGSLREQVGEHHDAGEVFDRDNATVDEIAKELGGAQSRKTGPAGATHREWDDLLRPAEPAPSRGRPARSLGSACAVVLDDGVLVHPGGSAGLL